MRFKKCPDCGDKYQPTRQMQPCCDSDECKAAFAIRHIEATRKRRRMEERKIRVAERKETNEERDSQKNIRQHANDTQRYVNAYIRARDKGKPCISCGRPLKPGFHAGHYKPVGNGLNWSIRYHHDNIHGQCVHCNLYKGGNQSLAREGVLDRIGSERLAFLDGPQPDAKFTVEQLKKIAADHRKLLKETLD